jgi:hypothetical protein
MPGFSQHSGVLGDREVVLPRTTPGGSEVNTSSVDQTLAEGWNGTGWSAESTPDAGTSTNDLFNVTCNRAACIAVGDYPNGSPLPQTLGESH